MGYSAAETERAEITGDDIKWFRKNRKMSLEAFAAAYDVTVERLQYLESLGDADIGDAVLEFDGEPFAHQP